MNRDNASDQLSRIQAARGLPVSARCRATNLADVLAASVICAVLRFENRLQVDRFQIAALFGEVSALVKDVSDAATHAGGKISAAGPEHQDQPLGHVFAAVVADAFDYGGRSGVANRKALARDAIEKRLAAGRAIKGNVANQNILFRTNFSGVNLDRLGGKTTKRPPDSPLPT